jgi:predicted RNase H-like HicB family nuclease
MLTAYIQAALRQAKYELMENGKFFARVPSCRSVWAEGGTLEDCREELQSTLEDWLFLGLQLGHKLPVINGINLNRKALTREPAYAKAHSRRP